MKKIAFFMPSDKKSAIGQIGIKICKSLSKIYDVHIWTQSKIEYSKISIPTYIISDYEEDLDILDEYDYLVYNLGNYAGYFREIYEIFEKKPGIVILHDQTMSGFFFQYFLEPQFKGGQEKGIELYKNMIKKYYGKEEVDRIDEYISRNMLENYYIESSLSVKLIEPILEKAKGIFTHGKFFIEKIKDTYAGPMGYSYLFIEENQLIKDDIYNTISQTNKIKIVSTGIVHPIKHIDVIVDVLQKNKNISKKVEYIVIGDFGGEYGEKLKRISENELKECLYMLGYQDKNVMDSAISNADLCVNLRYPNSEIGSLSLIEQLSYGIPVCVFASSIYGEMPDDAVIKVNFDNKFKEIKNILENIIKDKEYYKKIGEKAKLFVKKECTLNKYIENFDKFLKEVDKYSYEEKNILDNYIDKMVDVYKGLNISDSNLNLLEKNIELMYNILGESEEDNPAKMKNKKTIGIWIGFLYKIDNLHREGVTRFIVFFIKSIMEKYKEVNCEVWGYECNRDTISISFEIIKKDKELSKRIKFIDEKNFIERFNLPKYYEKLYSNICPDNDNLNILAREFSKADLFIPIICYLDNVIGVDKKIFVPMHDMVVSSRYHDFIKNDKLNKSRSLDIISKVKNLIYNNAIFFTNSKTVLNEQLIEYLPLITEGNCKVVYLPLNIPENIDKNIVSEKEVREKYNIFGDYLFYPTQIRPYKNIICIVKALKEVIKTYSDLKLILTGRIKDNKEIYDYVKKNNLTDNVIELESVSEEMLYSLYKYASCIPVTSLFEAGFPYQALEGMYSNTPVIVSELNIIKERIEAMGYTKETCGFEMFNPSDCQELAEKIIYVLKNKERVVNGQKEFKDKILSYTWDNAATKYYEILFGYNYV